MVLVVFDGTDPQNRTNFQFFDKDQKIVMQIILQRKYNWFVLLLSLAWGETQYTYLGKEPAPFLAIV